LDRFAFSISEDAVTRPAIIVVRQNIAAGEFDALSKFFAGAGCKRRNVRLELLHRLVNADSQRLAFEAEKALPQRQPRMGAAGGCAKDNPVRIYVLLHEFFHRKDVAHCAGDARTAVWDEIRFPAGGDGFIESLLQDAVAVFAVWNDDDFRAEELVEQKIGCRLAGAFARQDKDAVKTETGGGGSRLTAMIRLNRSRRDERIRTLFAGFGDEKFQLAGFVSAESQTCLVVAFDENARSAEGVGQARKFFDGGGKVSEIDARNFVHRFSFFGIKRLNLAWSFLFLSPALRPKGAA
jgi:hypothetical protein